MARKQSGEGSAIKTKLVFRWAAVASGSDDDEEVRVVGSIPELGAWRPSDGVVLSRVDADGYCCWLSRGVPVPLGKQVEYRYAFCKQGTGELLRWEAHEPSRTVRPTGRRHVLEDDGGRYRILSLARDRVASGESEFPSAFARQTSTVSVVMDGKDDPDGASRVSLNDILKDGSLPDPKRPTSLSTTSLSRHLNDVAELRPEDTVFFIMRSLPVTPVRDEKSGEWTLDAVRSNKGRTMPELLQFIKNEDDAEQCKVKFVGLPGVEVKDDSERKKLSELLAQHSCIPVFVDKEVEDHHLDFSINFLWPVFHSQKTFDTMAEDQLPSSYFNEAKWKCYQALNNAYAEAIAQKANADTLLWVHDYQLLLVPRYIYLRCPDWHVGFFLHCAFPSSEVVRCLPNREEILQSLLSCKLVTFQIFDYMRNFLSTCALVLGVKHTFAKGGMLQVEHDCNICTVSADHFVLPYEHLSHHWGKESVLKMAEDIRAKFPDRTILGCYDRADRFAGLSLKVRAFQRFLKEYSGYQGKVVLVQYVTTCTDHGQEDTNALLHDLEELAQETNKAFQRPGEPPVVTIVQEDLDRDKRMAVLQATDVLFDTSINDGLNLVPFQFYAAHTEDQRGAVVVSEFCGCSSVLTGVFKVNPWDMSAIMVALDQALSLEPSEQAVRFAKDHSYVASQTVMEWVSKNLCELRSSLRSSLGQRNQQLAGHLNLDSVLEDYRSAKTRAIFVDNEGTIAAKAGWQSGGGMTMLKKEGNPPDERVLDCLQTLAQDGRNTVVVLSGRDPKCMERWFRDVKDVGLCAEHGYHWLPPKSLRVRGDGEDSRQWRCIASEDERLACDEWKAIVFELMKQYVKRVQGSIVECKDSAISWNYRGVGAPVVVESMARELARFLSPSDTNGVMHGYPVEVISGKGYVEVKRKDVDKGITVTRLVDQLQQQIKKPVDFVLCIGDDRSDEAMFEAVARQCQPAQPGGGPVPQSPPRRRRRGKEDSMSVRLTMEVRRGPGSNSALSESTQEDLLHSYTVTVGRKPSKAQYFVHDVSEVTLLLQKLAAQSVVSSFSRFSSLPNLLVEEAQEDEDLPEDSAQNMGRMSSLVS